MAIIEDQVMMMLIMLKTIGWFLSGVLLINVLPHLIQGISGNRFPSAFDKPHGKKLSSPTLNVIWAFINLSIVLTILYFNHTSLTALYGVIMLLGAFVMALYLSKYFAGKDNDQNQPS